MLTENLNKNNNYLPITMKKIQLNYVFPVKKLLIIY